MSYRRERTQQTVLRALLGHFKWIVNGLVFFLAVVVSSKLLFLASIIEGDDDCFGAKKKR